MRWWPTGVRHPGHYADWNKAARDVFNDTRFDKFLTADQQKVWRELTGDPYTFRPTFTPPANGCVELSR